MNPWLAGVLFGGAIGFALGVIITIAWSLAAASSRADDAAELRLSVTTRRADAAFQRADEAWQGLRESPDYVPDDWSA